jgi:hypothetical protein
MHVIHYHKFFVDKPVTLAQIEESKAKTPVFALVEHNFPNDNYLSILWRPAADEYIVRLNVWNGDKNGGHFTHTDYEGLTENGAMDQFNKLMADHASL